MNNQRNHAIFASIGPPMKDKKDPVKFVVENFGARIIYLIGSDEDPIPNRGASQDNYRNIKERYNDISVHVEGLFFKLGNIEDGIFRISKLMIHEIITDPNLPLVIDPTGGRMEMSIMILQAAHLTLVMLDKYASNIDHQGIICGIKAQGKPMIQFNIQLPKLPPAYIFEVMNEISLMEERITDEELGKIFGKDQTTISRWLSALDKFGFLERKGHDKSITFRGQAFKDLFEEIEKS